MLPFLLLTAAHAGYGDARDGFPSAEERLLHLWTNAARVDPEAFADDYARGGCSLSAFTAIERLPKPPLALQHDLNVVARAHSADMRDMQSVTHTSSDGTTFADRVWDVYPGSGIGENVAGGYTSAYDAVFEGWMCSAGHRENIMAPDWDELGVGVDGVFYTQDFGTRGIARPVLAMGAHSPPRPGTSADFYVDVFAKEDPSAVLLMLDGTPVTMTRAWGTRRQGVYEANARLSAGCHVYWFAAQVAGEVHRFPEDGAYGFGDCDFDDAAAGWVAAANVPAGGGSGGGETGGDAGGGDPGLWPGDDTDPPVLDTPRAGGCDQGGIPAGAAALPLAWLALVRRRRA